MDSGLALRAPRNDVGREHAPFCRLGLRRYLKHTDVSFASNELPGIGRSGSYSDAALYSICLRSNVLTHSR